MLSTVSPFAIDMYLPAFGGIATALHTSTAHVSLSISSYFIGLAAGQILYGPLLDRFGRKPPIYIGLALFIAASVLCMFSRDIRWLVFMRFIQAVAGCAAGISAMAMVRDFFPVHETAKIISLLILILGVSPLLAPTVGGFIAVHWGWRSVFIVLALFALLNIVVCWWYLPDGHKPDASVSLKPGPILRNFVEVFKNPQFTTYSVSGSFSFSGLLVYVASSSIVFMEAFHVTAQQFGMIFAGLAVGFIGSNQINVLLLRRFSSDKIYLAMLLVECPMATVLLAGTYFGWFGLWPTLVLLFITLSSLGLAFPNAAALAITPFDRNIGSATAMLGFVQIGVSSLASALIGVFDSHEMLPVVLILAVTAWIGLAVLLIGKRRIPELRYVEEQGADLLTD